MRSCIFCHVSNEISGSCLQIHISRVKRLTQHIEGKLCTASADAFPNDRRMFFQETGYICRSRKPTACIAFQSFTNDANSLALHGRAFSAQLGGGSARAPAHLEQP